MAPGSAGILRPLEEPACVSKAITAACLVEAVHWHSNILFLPPDKIKSRRELFVSSIPVLI